MRLAASLIWLVFLPLLGQAAPPQIAGCPVLPADNVWNAPVDNLPRHPASDAYIATMGATRGVHPDFGTVYEGAPIGIPFVTVPGNQPKVPVTFEYDDESDPGPYPVPPNAPIEGGASSDGDRHVLVIDRDNCILYELFAAYPSADGSWRAGSGAIFPLRSNALRPRGWTSADAAGLPIFPGLVRYEEVAAGEIAHALRFTAPQTQRAFLWPARHFASSRTGAQYPPMGLRLRLRAGFDVAGFSPPVQVILRALKKYGMILADNGSAWYLTGSPDARWNDDMLVGELARVKGSDFEAVDTSSLMRDPDSGATSAAAAGADWTAAEYYHAGLAHYFFTAGPQEQANIDGGSAGPGWVRTGTPTFRVWSSPTVGTSPACRFYGNWLLGPDGRRIGPSSHFWTLDPAECEEVKRDNGWYYEGIAFHAYQTQNGACAAPLRPLYRAYNNGFVRNDSNHRYSTDVAILEAMRSQGWIVEGVAMCVE